MFEFTVVLAAVVAVIGTRWERGTRGQLGLGGLLSAAIGTRMLAVVISGCLTAVVAQAHGNDTTAEQPSAAVAEAPLEATSSEQKADVADLRKDKPEGTAAELAPVLAERPDEPVASSSSRPPVEFVANVRYLSTERPSWVESAPVGSGEDDVVVVRGGPFPGIRDCRKQLEQEVQLAAAEYINDYLEAPHASTLLRVPFKELAARGVVREQFSEQLETSLGLMSQVHARLVFDERFRDELDRRWSAVKSKSRLAQAGLGAGVVLLLLGTLFSFLKLDTATRGYYTGRLQIGVAATILTLIAASILLSKWIPWM